MSVPKHKNLKRFFKNKDLECLDIEHNKFPNQYKFEKRFFKN